MFCSRSDLEPVLSEAELVKSVENLRISETQENGNSDKEINFNQGSLAMPKPIRKSILKQNVKFLHNRQVETLKILIISFLIISNILETSFQ